MIRHEADGYYVELRATRYGRPTGPVIRWGPYGAMRDAAIVEKRNRAVLAAQPPPSRRRADRGAQPQLLDVS